MIDILGCAGTEDTAVEALAVAMDNNGTVFVGGRGGYNFGLIPVMLDSASGGLCLFTFSFYFFILSANFVVVCFSNIETREKRWGGGGVISTGVKCCLL